MPKKADEKPNAGAADPTADDTADKPTHNVVNASPGAVGSDDDGGDNVFDKVETDNQNGGVMNTTDTEYADDDELPETPKRNLSDKDRTAIKEAFNAPGAVVANIAKEYDIEPSEVFAIAEGK